MTGDDVQGAEGARPAVRLAGSVLLGPCGPQCGSAVSPVGGAAQARGRMACHRACALTCPATGGARSDLSREEDFCQASPVSRASFSLRNY